MSNRRKASSAGGGRPNTWLQDTLAPMDGAQVPGGCEDCDAYQVIAANPYGVPGVSAIQVHHDDWCPTLARKQGRRG